MSYMHSGMDCGEYHDVVVDYGGRPKPEIVVLCGSTRFEHEFIRVNQELTLQGKIVLSVGVFGTHGPGVEKVDLDQLHLRKIDLADSVFVVCPNGYIGDSTRREIEYAIAQGTPVTYSDEVEA